MDANKQGARALACRFITKIPWLGLRVPIHTGLSNTNTLKQKNKKQKARKTLKNEATANSLQRTKITKRWPLQRLNPPAPTDVYMTIEQFNEAVGNKVTDKYAYANNTETISVIGEALGRQLRGPASYKRRIVSNFLDDNPNINVPINIIVQKFKGYLNST